MTIARVIFTGVCLLAVVGVFALAQTAAPATSPAKGPATLATNKYSEFAKQRVKFDQFTFYGEKFPACDYEDPAAVKALAGEYTIAATFYDAAGKKVTAAEKPGRYAAVVEAKFADGKTSRRFATLCQLGKVAPPPSKQGAPSLLGADPEVLTDMGIDKAVAAEKAAEMKTIAGRWAMRPGSPAQRNSTEAIYLAALYDLTALKAAEKPLPSDTIQRIERQWWVTFKRGFYGYDKLYPNAFVCPKPLEGTPATKVHEGSLAQAGMKADADKAIDEACEAWVKETGTGFNLVVVRHGVIVFNKAYGNQTGSADKDAPFTTTTPAQTASATKFLGGILLAEFADQGLLNFDDEVAKYVLPMKGIQVKRPLTIRDMYLHIGGFAEIAGDYNPDLEEIVADMYPGMEVAVTHRYGGASLATGGKIMENISGESLPNLYMKHLVGPLGLKITNTDGTAGGAIGTAMDFAIVGQMMLNGGAYGDKRFLSPETIKKMQPIPGHDRWEGGGMEIRWGIGIKQIDTDGLSDQAYGHPGASGTCLVVDPQYDLVLSMTRFEEGPMSFKEFLKRKAKVYKAVLDGIDSGK